MESGSSSQRRDKGDKDNRRVWSKKEEEALLHALHDLLATVWKCDNGTFKAGYTIVLEKSMLRAFPSTDLKAKPQIDSKIKIWKKHYNSIYSALLTSGIGWNDTEKCLEIHDDNVWNTYIKVKRVLLIFIIVRFN